jgi:hypothetical protein
MHDFAREAASLEKARALRALFPRVGRLAVFALEDRPGALELAFAGDPVDERVVDTLGFQLLANLCRAVLAGEPFRPPLGVALVR